MAKLGSTVSCLRCGICLYRDKAELCMKCGNMSCNAHAEFCCGQTFCFECFNKHEHGDNVHGEAQCVNSCSTGRDLVL